MKFLQVLLYEYIYIYIYIFEKELYEYLNGITHQF